MAKHVNAPSTESGVTTRGSNVVGIKDITFDDQDRNLFLVKDPRVRADALRYHILPRMHVVLREAVSLIRRIYDVDVFEDSIESYYPHFRHNRERELSLLYTDTFVGLGGQRVKEKWHGITRKDGKPVQIVPFRYSFMLSASGFSWCLGRWLKSSDESNRSMLRFIVDNLDVVQSLCIETGMCPGITYGGSVRYLSPLRDQYRYMIDEAEFDRDYFVSPHIPYPLDSMELSDAIRRFALFFPVYDSFIQMAKGERPRFNKLIKLANSWCESDEGNPETTTHPHAVGDLACAAEAAEQRSPVLPARRWRVFKRDDHKCLACGRRPSDGIILHIDHILPRSKGGADDFDNYQTLCNLCNVGKSNRDATDLRAQL